LVFQVAHQLEVGRIAVQAVVALVVDLLLARDVTVVVGEHHQMYGDSLAIQTHPAITTTSACAGIRASSEVAGAWFVIEYEPGVFDTASGFVPIKNLVSSV